MRREVLIVGCGYLGARVAARHVTAGDRVRGVVRSAQSAAALEAAGVRALCADLDGADFAVPDPRYDLVYHFAPPPRSGDDDPRTRTLLAALPACGRLVYTSTTAVYGDAGGAWIDEDTRPAPTSARGRRRLDAERQLDAWRGHTGIDLVILRVAAIYGPGRLPRTRSAHGDVPVNRIHVDDLATVCVAAAERGTPGRVYDCADGNPTTHDGYIETLARLGGPDLRGTDPQPSGFMQESKRVRAARIRDELGVALRYPDHESGLRATLGSRHIM